MSQVQSAPAAGESIEWEVTSAAAGCHGTNLNFQPIGDGQDHFVKLTNDAAYAEILERVAGVKRNFIESDEWKLYLRSRAALADLEASLATIRQRIGEASEKVKEAVTSFADPTPAERQRKEQLQALIDVGKRLPILRDMFAKAEAAAKQLLTERLRAAIADAESRFSKEYAGELAELKQIATAVVRLRRADTARIIASRMLSNDAAESMANLEVLAKETS